MSAIDYARELEAHIAGGRNDKFRRIAHATYAVITEDLFGNYVVGIQYHQTVVCGIKRSGEYFVNNGGYFTVTTKDRINSFLMNVGDASRIRQHKGRWDIHGFLMKGQCYFYTDGTIDLDNVKGCYAVPNNDVAAAAEKVSMYR